MSYSVSSVEGVIEGTIYRSIMGVMKVDARSSDYSPHSPWLWRGP